MAAMPQQSSPPRPQLDFAPGSPPDLPILDNAPPNGPLHNPNDQRRHYGPTSEFGRSGRRGFANGNGAVPMPNGSQPHIMNGASRHRGTMSLGAFEGSRSPPSAKNTSHVPCKFFRSGQCQAGKACPFSHSTDVSTVDTPCKYFAKGNCKFGQKCALAHILPNGRRVNRPNGSMGGNLNIGPRIDPQLYQQSDPALAHSLLAQQASGAPAAFGQQVHPYADIDFGPQETLQAQPYDRDNGYSTHPDSKIGSPRDDSRLAFSPSARLSVLDAPLPASFDSQGISYMARHGPVAASVPSKFGLLESSPPSSLQKKAPIPLDAVRNLHSSAFGGREFRTRGQDMESSPIGSGDEGFGQRFMHSRRVPKPKLMSASLPKVDHPADDWDDDTFQFSGGEEDYIPTSIHDQILTPQEKLRRHSRTEQDRKGLGESYSGVGSPTESSSKVGSPNTGSPSRYGPLFARQQQDATSNMAGSPSAFGHVGSPLRNSSFHSGMSPPHRATRPGDMSPSFPSLSSPPRQTSMSMLSQQLSRTRLTSKTSEATDPSSTTSNSLYPSSARHSSAPSSSLNRAVSSSSVGRTDRIEEEQGDYLFPMEEDSHDQRKHHSGNAWGYNPWKESPKLSPVGTGRASNMDGRDLWN